MKPSKPNRTGVVCEKRLDDTFTLSVDEARLEVVLRVISVSTDEITGGVGQIVDPALVPDADAQRRTRAEAD